MNKLTCEICFKEFKQITNTHLKSHELSKEQYLELFPNASLISEELINRMKLTAQKSANNTRGKPRSEAVKQKMSAAQLARYEAGVTVWNKGKTTSAETKQKLSKIKIEQYASGEIIHHMLGKKHSEETKQKISDTCKGYEFTEIQKTKHQSGISNWRNSENYTAPMLYKLHSVESKIKIGNAGRGDKNHMHRKCIDNINKMASVNNINILEYDDQFVNLQCNKCDTPFRFTKQMFNETSDRKTEYCPTCYPRQSGTSILEKEVYDFIKTIYLGSVIHNDREQLGGKEIDIFIPDLSIGVEFTGLYWHSEKQNPNKNHLLWKKQFAHNIGLRLITIFEDEWLQKPEIVKSRLAGFLNLHVKKIYARKCKIEIIDSTTKNLFLSKCHIQGKDSSSVNLGLMYENKLVSVATFKLTNMIKGGDGSAWELSRFCSELNTRVVGGANKLLQHFIKTFSNGLDIISYADSRWSTGDLYKTLGFDFVSSTPISYWYTADYKIRKHRSGFMKHTLIEKEEDNLLTEWEIMQRKGYDRIWDCGTTKWILKSNK